MEAEVGAGLEEGGKGGWGRVGGVGGWVGGRGVGEGGEAGEACEGRGACDAALCRSPGDQSRRNHQSRHGICARTVVAVSSRCFGQRMSRGLYVVRRFGAQIQQLEQQQILSKSCRCYVWLYPSVLLLLFFSVCSCSCVITPLPQRRAFGDFSGSSRSCLAPLPAAVQQTGQARQRGGPPHHGRRGSRAGWVQPPAEP